MLDRFQSGEIYWGHITAVFRENALEIIYSLLIVALVCCLLSILVTFVASSTISKPVTIINSFIRDLSRGKIANQVEIKNKDEIGEMAKELNALIENLKKKARLAENIAEGDLTYQIELVSCQPCNAV